MFNSFAVMRLVALGSIFEHANSHIIVSVPDFYQKNSWMHELITGVLINVLLMSIQAHFCGHWVFKCLEYGKKCSWVKSLLMYIIFLHFDLADILLYWIWNVLSWITAKHRCHSGGCCSPLVFWMVGSPTFSIWKL